MQLIGVGMAMFLLMSGRADQPLVLPLAADTTRTTSNALRRLHAAGAWSDRGTAPDLDDQIAKLRSHHADMTQAQEASAHTSPATNGDRPGWMRAFAVLNPNFESQ